jgi:K+-sensing histidine kinase KdpD
MTQTQPNAQTLVRAVAICLAAVLLTTSVLWIIEDFIPARHLMLGYLLLAIFIAILFGGILAVLTAFACGLTAAYFLLPPKFSFSIDDPAEMAELALTLILAVVAAASVHALARVTRGRTDSSWWPP